MGRPLGRAARRAAEGADVAGEDILILLLWLGGSLITYCMPTPQVLFTGHDLPHPEFFAPMHIHTAPMHILTGHAK